MTLPLQVGHGEDAVQHYDPCRKGRRDSTRPAGGPQNAGLVGADPAIRIAVPPIPHHVQHRAFCGVRLVGLEEVGDVVVAVVGDPVGERLDPVADVGRAIEDVLQGDARGPARPDVDRDRYLAL